MIETILSVSALILILLVIVGGLAFVVYSVMNARAAKARHEDALDRIAALSQVMEEESQHTFDIGQRVAESDGLGQRIDAAVSECNRHFADISRTFSTMGERVKNLESYCGPNTGGGYNDRLN